MQSSDNRSMALVLGSVSPWYGNPEWWLFIAAIPTFFLVWYQARETARAARATEDNVKLQKVAMEQWIEVDDPEAQKHILATATESEFPIEFTLRNPTKFPLTLMSVKVWVDRQHTQTVWFRSLLLSPDEGIPVVVKWHIEGVKLANYRSNHLHFELGGLICFVDAFKQDRQQRFGFTCHCWPSSRGEFALSAFTPPDEEEVKNQQKRRQGQK
jgi:hypothetical protein